MKIKGFAHILKFRKEQNSILCPVYFPVIFHFVKYCTVI